MKPIIDLTKEYSLVLEGGGAKGAYQVGAWKALNEAGIKINAVAGTSVGALNGAMICMGDVENAIDLWQDITFSKVMDVDDEIMMDIINHDGNVADITREIMRLISDRGADITPLKKLIEENIDEDYIRKGSIAFYLLTFSITELKELDIDLKEEPYGLLADYLLASAYLPVFKNEKLHGKVYMDGGMFNNVPLGSIINRDYKNIIMIRIFGIGREKKVKIPEDVEVITIEPKVNLGNILDFDSKKSRRNIKIGYYDAMRVIYGLSGDLYYINIDIEENEKECYYLNKLLHIYAGIYEYITHEYRMEDNPNMHMRNLLEVIYPAIAMELKLGKQWNYTDLYIAMLEATAKIFKIQKYKIYTDCELRDAIIRKSKKYLSDELLRLPAFAIIILNDESIAYSD